METIKFARQCSETGNGMNEGWVFRDGEKYASTEKAATVIAKSYGFKSIKDMVVAEECYWTVFDKDDKQYEEYPIHCNKCNPLTINGKFCHEKSCENEYKQFFKETGEWKWIHTCFDCGGDVVEGEVCECQEQAELL